MPSTVQISDFSDREILGMMHDLARGAPIGARELALRAFGLNENGDRAELVRAARCVTARLSWMRRFGLVEKGDEQGEWMPSDAGRQLQSGRLAAPVLGGIERSAESQALALAYVVGERLVRANPVSRTAMRRELQYHFRR